MSDSITASLIQAASGSDTGSSEVGTENNVSVENTSEETISDSISAEEWAKLAKRKMKHKVDGKEVELSLEEALRGYSHSSAANKRMEQAAAERKAAAA